MEFRDRDLALKLFFNKRDEQSFECEQCIFTNKHNEKVLEPSDILDISGVATSVNESHASVLWKSVKKTWKI